MTRRSIQWPVVLVIATLGMAGPWFSAQAAQSDTQDTQAQDTQVDALSRKKAKQWHLSVDEWQRYKKLKQGFDGYLSDHLDPITLLGINARSTEERQRYARDLARLMHDYTERVLAFQKAYDKAFKSLYPNEHPVNTQSLGGALSQGQQAARKLGLETTRKAVVVRA